MSVAGVAYANSISWGNVKDTGTINGYNYYNQAWIQTVPNLAGASMGTVNGGNAPSGYMGIQASLYSAGGTLCQDTLPYYYSASSTNYIGVGTVGICGAGNYYSKGWSRAYNGNGYTTYPSYLSPDLYLS